jgi:hypothetical protein
MQNRCTRQVKTAFSIVSFTSPALSFKRKKKFVFRLNAAGKMGRLRSGSGGVPLRQIKEGRDQPRPLRLESVSVAKKADIHFLFSRKPKQKKLSRQF